MARRYWKIPSSSFEVEAIPPPPSASPPEVGSIASTSQDSEGIFQYLLAMLMPLLQCTPVDNSIINFTIVRRCTLINGILLGIFIFDNITMAVAEAWLGGIGKYPPYPSRLCNTPLVRRLRLRTSGGYCQPLRMRWVFSNIFLPCLCHCPIAMHCPISHK